ncbi:hypothetical protein KGF57_002611 [Candida theae]|uniref:Uncharacterized protein n=1 Tax=Candida theae TaxID=1198502 RepID=A0AAD5BEP3_9ASCO|nr:uncharacterized protein KGF57_002611 [Candida theae]KAI5958256.1 hypothetical protein KGF57_002611 [Candida theae]
MRKALSVALATPWKILKYTSSGKGGGRRGGISMQLSLQRGKEEIQQTKEDSFELFPKDELRNVKVLLFEKLTATNRFVQLNPSSDIICVASRCSCTQLVSGVLKMLEKNFCCHFIAITDFDSHWLSSYNRLCRLLDKVAYLRSTQDKSLTTKTLTKLSRQLAESLAEANAEESNRLLRKYCHEILAP